MPYLSAQDCDGNTRLSGLNLIFEDDFDHSELDLQNWFPYYLPHWSTLDASSARFQIKDSVLRLYVDEEQPIWRHDLNDCIKVSGIQTGHFSGPLDSPHGQHRFRPDLKVLSALPAQRLFVPQYCRLEMKARAKLNAWNLAALWLIGFEDVPERSGEITLFEAFGDRVQPSACRIGRGVKKLNDPKLYDEIDESALPINVQDWHLYTMDWNAFGIAFFVDGELITKTTQSPDYSMQLMLNIYDLGAIFYGHPEKMLGSRSIILELIRSRERSLT